MAPPRHEDYSTHAEFNWADKQWRKQHGGSLLSVLLIALVFGGLSGSTTVLFAFVTFAFVAWMVARTRT